MTQKEDAERAAQRVEYFIKTWEWKCVGRTIRSLQDGPDTCVELTIGDLETLLQDRAALDASAEPVAWRYFDGEGNYEYLEDAPSESSVYHASIYGRKFEPLFTRPSASKHQGAESGRAVLSDEALEQAFDHSAIYTTKGHALLLDDFIYTVRALLAAQPQQPDENVIADTAKPVGVRFFCPSCGEEAEYTRVAATTEAVRDLIADDAYAMSFQSLGQYRTALLKAIAAPAIDAAPENSQAVALSTKQYRIGQDGENWYVIVKPDGKCIGAFTWERHATDVVAELNALAALSAPANKEPK